MSVKSALCHYFNGGLPDGFLTMNEKELDNWFDDNMREDKPSALPCLNSGAILNADQAINFVFYDACSVLVVREDGSEAMISVNGFSAFVFGLLEAECFGEKLLID